MADKARHAFGNSDGVETALQNGVIDAYDILFLDGETEPKIGWIDKNGIARYVKTQASDLSDLENQVSGLEKQLDQKVDAETVQTMIKEVEESANIIVEF